MTNAQFYMGVAIPSFLIILAWLHQNVRLTEFRSDVHRQFDTVTKQFEDVSKQFDRVDTRLTRIEEDQKQFFRTTGIIDGRLDELSSRVK